MGRPIEGGDAYENAILRPERNVAPRLQAGYAALVELLIDGERSRAECYAAIEESGESGLAHATAASLIEKAIYHGQLLGRFGYEQRIGASGVVRNIRVYVAFRLTKEAIQKANRAVTRDP